jgi:hypothetical protein
MLLALVLAFGILCCQLPQLRLSNTLHRQGVLPNPVLVGQQVTCTIDVEAPSIWAPNMWILPTDHGHSTGWLAGRRSPPRSCAIAVRLFRGYRTRDWTESPASRCRTYRLRLSARGRPQRIRRSRQPRRGVWRRAGGATRI